MSPSLNMPVPPEGYCTRQCSASSRVYIVAPDHDLGLLRTITRVPSGHLLSGSAAPDAGTLEAAGSLPVAAATSSAPALGGASLGSSLTERSGEADRRHYGGRQRVRFPPSVHSPAPLHGDV